VSPSLYCMSLSFYIHMYFTNKRTLQNFFFFSIKLNYVTPYLVYINGCYVLAWSLILKNDCSLRVNCHATEKSEAIATCKEMTVIPVNEVVDKTRIIGKRGLRRRKRHLGSLIPPPPDLWARGYIGSTPNCCYDNEFKNQALFNSSECAQFWPWKR
jgi:hypothetical protein